MAAGVNDCTDMTFLQSLQVVRTLMFGVIGAEVSPGKPRPSSPPLIQENTKEFHGKMENGPSFFSTFTAFFVYKISI